MGCGSSLTSRKVSQDDFKDPTPFAQQNSPNANIPKSHAEPMRTVKVYICYYSMYGKILTLSRSSVRTFSDFVIPSSSLLHLTFFAVTRQWSPIDPPVPSATKPDSNNVSTS